jgi:hypothetical protein
MTTDVTVDAQSIARQFASAIQHELDARQLWLRQHRDYVELWLMTAPADTETERRFAAAYADLIAAYPRAHIRPRLLNPCHFDDERALQDALPQGAQQSPLRA